MSAMQEAVAVPAVPPAPDQDPVWMIRGVRAAITSIRPKNTGKAYDPKVLEFREFCSKVYPQNAATPELAFLVNANNVYAFLWYQAYRSKKSRKGKKRKKGDDDNHFDYADYQDVRAKYATPAGAQATTTAIPDNACGFSILKSYISAIKGLWHEQQAENANSHSWESIRNLNVINLLKWVKARVPALKRQNYAEKLDHTFAPYLYAQHVKSIEATLFERNIWSSSRSALGSLRNRFCFLETTTAILRGESLFKAELSDCLDLTVSPEREPHPFYISVTQIPEGKTNHSGRTIYGRAMRHRIPEMCPIGAKALYLMFRFKVTGEMDPPPDFTSNEAWFDIKLLVDSTSTRASNTTSVSDQYYAKTIKQVCSALKVPVTHFVHFGRKAGPPLLELEEVIATEIAELGNWNKDTMTTFYSAQIPLSTLRVAAGFGAERGRHFNPRTSVIADDALAKQIFPFVEGCLADIEAATIGDGKERYTAYHFLNMLRNLRQVVLQDAAAMMGNGRNHPVFTMPVFQAENFKSFQQRVLHEITHTTNPANAQMDAIIPGINEHFGNLQSAVSANGRESKLGFAQILGIQNETLQMLQALQQQHNKGAVAARLMADSYNTGSPGSPLTETGAATLATAATGRCGDATAIAALPSPPNLQAHHLFSGHASATSMHNEWYGRASFTNKPCEGGIDAAEKHSKLWRRHFQSAEAMRFSRLKQVVGAIRMQIEQGRSESNVLTEFDQAFGQAGNITSLIKILKEKKYIVAKRKSG